MAYVKQLSIKSKKHLSQALEYIVKEEKTDNSKLVSGVNCNAKNAVIEFDTIKKLYGKEDGILAHHVIQSFKGYEVDPETANKIGIEFAERIAPGYQAVVCTHIDKGNLHNHIFINSVNLETGYKYYANKTSLKFSREESDKLCKEHKLFIIEPKGKSSYVDQSTYRLAEQGKSWKVKIARTIDEALGVAKTKDEFIKYMNTFGYEVKWQNKNISFKDPEHEKFIRGYRLGESYTKEAIENRLGIFEERNTREEQNILRNVSGSYERTSGHEGKSKTDTRESGEDIRKNRKARKYENEWEKYQSFRRKNNISKTSLLTKIFEEDKKREDRVLDRQLKFISAVIRLIKKIKRKRKANTRIKINKSLKGNVRDIKLSNKGLDIRYRDLKAVEGANYYLKGALEDALKLKEQSILCVTFNKGDYYNIVIKEKDKLQAFKILNKENKKDMECGAIRFREFKELVDKPHYINLSINEYERLKDSSIKFAAFSKGEVIKTVIVKEDLAEVIKTIGREVELQIGNITYSKLKSMSCNTEYRVINENQYNILKDTSIKFAAFQKEDGKINIAFKSQDLKSIDRICNNTKDRGGELGKNK